MRTVTLLLFVSVVHAQPNPFAGSEQAVSEGREIYNSTCTACHGADGAAGDRGPALGLPGRRYVRNTDAQIFDAVLKGIPGTGMPATKMSEQDAWKVAAYVRGLRGTAIDAPAKGNPARGEQVFWDKGECGKCHMLRGKGGLTAPDLTNIAGLRKLNSIRDALTKADHRVAGDGGRHETVLYPLSSYAPVRAVTRAGRTIRGVIKNEDSFSIQLLGFDEKLYSFARADLKDIVYEPKSEMPTDYDKRLAPDEFQDLLAFLSRQGVSAQSAPAPRRAAE
jgi:putative heme-binding domain-containing protein